MGERPVQFRRRFKSLQLHGGDGTSVSGPFKRRACVSVPARDHTMPPRSGSASAAGPLIMRKTMAPRSFCAASSDDLSLDRDLSSGVAAGAARSMRSNSRRPIVLSPPWQRRRGVPPSAATQLRTAVTRGRKIVHSHLAGCVPAEGRRQSRPPKAPPNGPVGCYAGPSTRTSDDDPIPPHKRRQGAWRDLDNTSSAVWSRRRHPSSAPPWTDAT